LQDRKPQVIGTGTNVRVHPVRPASVHNSGEAKRTGQGETLRGEEENGGGGGGAKNFERLNSRGQGGSYTSGRAGSISQQEKARRGLGGGKNRKKGGMQRRLEFYLL